MPSPTPTPKRHSPSSRLRSRSGTGLNTTTISSPWRRWLNRRRIGYLMAGGWAIAAAIATTGQLPLAQWLERQTQAVFFRLRGSIAPPREVVIVAIDDYSLTQGQLYNSDPQNLAAFEPLQSSPWQRRAYAIAIEKLMQAGAKTVALPIVFDSPSSYGEADDRQLQQVLQKYGDRLVIGAVYEEEQTRGGNILRLAQPNSSLHNPDLGVGFINFPLAVDNRIHEFASEYPQQWIEDNPDLASVFGDIIATQPSFAQATLEAAGRDSHKATMGDMFFYGPPGTFEPISFADILDVNNWENYLKNGQFFQDKIVLIGSTSALHKDFHRTAIAEAMSGVEIHANAIASLLEQRLLVPVFVQPWQKGLFVFVLVMGTSWLICPRKNWQAGLGVAVGSAIAWGSISYMIFASDRLILPTAVPSAAIILSGLSYGTLGAIREIYNKRHLRRTFKHYASSPIIQEIISQQDDLQDLLQERHLEMLEMTLAGRYRVVAQLSSGGFGETYIAEDTLRPGNPRCVVKKLQPTSNNPKHWELAERLFLTEAQILERLGKHEQIPQLLAYFEEGEEFYLVEELIVGRALGDEWPVDIPLSENEAVAFLRDFLPVLQFIHSQGAIHRDIKPDNIIRRKSDNQLVLIDFGAVKEMQTLSDDNEPEKTVAIGTRGYAPKEQVAGSPRFNSDIYAAGMLAIHGLTLLHPAKLPEDLATGEILWQDKARVSESLAAILNKMIRVDFRDRYQSVEDVLTDLQPWIDALPAEFQRPTSENRDLNQIALASSNIEATMPWTDTTQADTQLTAATEADLASESQPSSLTQELDRTLAFPSTRPAAVEALRGETKDATEDETIAFNPSQNRPTINSGEESVEDETIAFNPSASAVTPQPLSATTEDETIPFEPLDVTDEEDDDETIAFEPSAD